MRPLTLTSSILTLSLLGCGAVSDPDSPDGGSQQLEQILQDMAGTWVSSCIDNALDDYIYEVSVDGAQATLTVEHFKAELTDTQQETPTSLTGDAYVIGMPNPKCQTLASTTTRVWTIDSGGLNNSMMNIGLKVDAAGHTIHSNNLVSLANNNNWWGYSDWSKDSVRNIAGLNKTTNDAPEPSVDDNLAAIAQVSNGELSIAWSNSAGGDAPSDFSAGLEQLIHP